MTKLILLVVAMASFASAGSVIDRIVVVVGNRAIKQSDLERDLRVTQFLNGEALSSNQALQKKALERLIDQELIRTDIGAATNTSSTTKDAQALYDQIVKERFGGSIERLNADLHRRGIKESELLQQLQWQLEVLRFIDERFRPSVLITDEQVKQFYDDHKQEFAKETSTHSFDALTPQIREKLEADAVDKEFEDWIAERRRRISISYKVEGFK